MVRMTPDLKIRADVLQGALLLEELASSFLAELLGVKNKKVSLSFGNKSSALSFNQKINLLIDMGAVDKDSRNKFQTFMEIRNQFMHNINATSYEACFSFTDSKDKYILKTYPQNNKLPREEQLRLAVEALNGDLLFVTAQVIKKIESNIENEVTAKVNKETIDDIHKSIAEAKTLLNDWIDREIEKGTNFTAKKLKGMGTFVSGLIYRLVIKKIKKEE